MSEPAIILDSVGKKFATSLKKAMAYGMRDIMLQASRQSQAHVNSGDVALRNGEFWAVKDLSLQIERGERVGIIGHNGAGKSTLLSMLSGIYGPSTGRIEIHGSLQALIELGAGFHPKLTGLENIYINASILGLRKHEIERKVEEIVEFADIGDFVHAPVKTYSSGMLVRLAFGIAVAIHPDIMVIDEVLAVGDAVFQTKCVGYSQRLAEEGKTVLMVSHQLPHIQRICNRVLWMDHGRLVMDGPTGEVVRAYSSAMMQRSADKSDSSHEVKSEQISFSYAISCEGVPDSEIPDHAKDGLPVVVSGYNLVITVRYEAHQVPSGKLNFWFHVKDALSGVRIMGGAAREGNAGIPVSAAGQKGEFRIIFPNVILNDGLYCLDLGVVDLTSAGESHVMARTMEQQPSFIVVTNSSQFHTPYSGAEGNRTPLIHVPIEFEHELL